MAKSNKPAGTAAYPLEALTVLRLLMPNQPATDLKTPTFEGTILNQYDEVKPFC